MKKYLIKEVAPEETNFEWFFEDDCFNENAVDYGYTLFIVNYEGWCRWSGYNVKEWENIIKKADYILEDFEAVSAYKEFTYKDVMQDYGIPYSPTKCHALKEWAKNADTNKIETMIDFLTITTGHKWESISRRGYSQGDFATVIFCKDFHTEEAATIAGDLYLGCGKEFYVIELDNDGEEIDACGGYMVADCQAWKDEEYKRLVCEWAGIPEDETELQMIDNCYTSTRYTYRTA